MDPVFEQLSRALADRYELELEVGRGGMARVYRARDIRHDRAVAVKVLHPELAASLGAERFLREVRITARLSHPHILPLLDSGESNGLLWYVMPFATGESLRERLDREGALPVEQASAVTQQVADALAHAHSKGVVHRDIKPENILLESGNAFVVDFGIARAVGEAVPDKLTKTGWAVGTPYYMSPEQSDGTSKVDHRTDIYSLGCVLFEMLAGQLPFSAPTVQVMMARRFSEPAPSVLTMRSNVAPAIDAVLRRALERNPADRFQTAQEFSAALRSNNATTIAAPVEQPPKSSRALLPAVALLAVASIGASVFLWTRTDTDSASSDVQSVAVLPFANNSTDTEQQYFADGLTDELIASLSRVNGLRVASRTSSFAYREQGLDVREIGRRLGVNSVLEGSVRRGGDSLRVTVQLVDVSNGYQRWSNTFQGEAKQALVFQEQIASSIVRSLQGDAGGTEPAHARGSTTDPEAYDLYLRGLFFRHRRTEEGLRRAVDHFQRAVERAPRFARAHSGLAEALAVIGFYDYEPAATVFPAAARAAEKALQIEPGLGSAHATLGYVALYNEWNWPKAEAAFLEAIRNEPDYATAHQWYANYLTAMGRFDEARREMRLAQQLDPLLLIAGAAYGWVLYHEGNLDGAAAQYRSILERDSTFVLANLWLGQALQQLGQADEAEHYLSSAVRFSNDGAIFLAALAHLHATRGRTEEARQQLTKVRAARIAPAFEIAKVYVALKDTAEALRWLQRAYDERSHSMAFLRIDPQLKSLHGNAEFERIVKLVGVPEPAQRR